MIHLFRFLPPETLEDEAKQIICRSMDSFLRNRIEVAGKLILEFALNKVAENEVILTYGKSSLVTGLLMSAKESGKKFRVIVVCDGCDPEGNELASFLANNSIPCTMISLSSINFVLKEATKVFLGAQCIFSNGSVLSRLSTAVIGLMASQHNVPVVILAETLKFGERVQLDALVSKELDDPGPMVEACSRIAPEVRVGACKPLYDVMPAEYVTMVVSEVGMIPVTSVPVVLRGHPY